VKAKIGYERTASLVAEAAASGRSLLRVLVDEGVASEAQVRDLLQQSSCHPDA
jgi:aspartate ammonia-lyase